MVERESTSYMERLDVYEARERAQLDSSGAIKPQCAKRTPKEKSKVQRTVSATDPDAGMLNRPGKPKGMHYLSHQSVDAAHGIVVDVAVTAGNANDSEPYLERIEYMRNHLGLNIKKTGAGSAYGASLICQTLEDMGIELCTPKATGGVNYKVAFTRKDFIYQQANDCFICPVEKNLTLRSLEREHYNICRTYRADRKDCGACPMLSQCVATATGAAPCE